MLLRDSGARGIPAWDPSWDPSAKTFKTKGKHMFCTKSIGASLRAWILSSTSWRKAAKLSKFLYQHSAFPSSIISKDFYYFYLWRNKCTLCFFVKWQFQILWDAIMPWGSAFAYSFLYNLYTRLTRTYIQEEQNFLTIPQRFQHFSKTSIFSKRPRPTTETANDCNWILVTGNLKLVQPPPPSAAIADSCTQNSAAA